MPTKPLKTFTGSFQDIRLGFTPEPPLTEEERSKLNPNYPTEMAFLHIYLGGQDAVELIPSAFFCPLIEGIFEAIPTVAAGGTASAQWYSDPWRFDMHGDPVHNRVYITLHVPGRWVAMQNVSVPLDQFASEVIRMGQKWLKYLDSVYHSEIVDPEWGKQYRQLEHYLHSAQEAYQKFEGH